MKLIILIFLVLISLSGFSQDLNARVQILSPQIQNTNKRTLEVLELAITEFLNNRKWSDAQLQASERIDCNIVITVKEWDGSSSFKTEAQILSSRPVFGSSYNSTILTLNDKNFDFNYSEGQALDFTDQNYINNLSSLLAFYAYTIVGLDADTFSKLGGTNYFTKAQTVLNNAQNTSFTGWKAFENLKNRYWLIENLNNKSYAPLRELLYSYHRQGLDLMSENPNKGRKNIADALPALSSLDKQKQGALLNLVFFLAKADEIISIFSKSDAIERTKIYNILADVDPANISKYELLKNPK
jgi:hypothetical protein